MRYLRVCSRCSTVVSRGVSSCPSCYILLNPETIRQVKLCERDGTPVQANENFCTTCGRGVEARYLSAKVWLSVLVLLGIASTLFFTNLHRYVYNAYRPASCAITGAYVTSYRSGKRTRYKAYFTYRVLQKDSQQLISSGEGTLGLDSSWARSDIQSDIERYHVGATYACWYSALALSEVRLLPPDVTYNSLWDSLAWFFGTMFLFFLVGLCLVRLIWYRWSLYVHLVNAQGRVVGREYRRSNKRSYIVSIIEFQTQTMPALRCRTEKRGTLDLQSWLPVCYDWLRPASNVRVRATYGAMMMFVEVVWGVFLTLLLIGMALAFFVWLAFSFS